MVILHLDSLCSRIACTVYVITRLIRASRDTTGRYYYGELRENGLRSYYARTYEPPCTSTRFSVQYALVDCVVFLARCLEQPYDFNFCLLC